MDGDLPSVDSLRCFVAVAEQLSFRRAAAEVARRLSEAGVFQTPAYLLGDEVFIGRQHLPLIRWRLEGERGPGPI